MPAESWDEPFFREWRAARAWEEFHGTPRVVKRSLRRSLLVRGALGLTRALPVPAVLVVGSKGKGTAVAAASWALRQAGLRVGTVTSPPLRSNRERIRINGEAMSENAAMELSERADRVIASLPCFEPHRALGPGDSAIDTGAAGGGAKKTSDLERGGRAGEAAKENRHAPQASEASEPGASGAGTSDETSGYLSPSGLFTLCGIAHLLEHGAQALVIEEGLGGLSDEVAHFDYPAVAVTQIFPEHLDVLGGSVEAVEDDLLGTITAATCTVVTHPEQSERVNALLTSSAAHVVRAPRGADLLETNLGIGLMAADALGSGIGAGAAGSGNDGAGEAGAGKAATAGSTGAAGAANTGAHSAGDDAADSPGENQAGVGEQRLAAVRAALTLPARSSLHTRAGHTWMVDAAISPTGIRSALQQAAANLRGDFLVLAGFPDVKDVDACLAALAGHDVVLVGAGREYLNYRQASEHGLVLSVDEAFRAADARSSDVFTVGTLSFAGAVLDALGAATDSWWD